MLTLRVVIGFILPDPKWDGAPRVGAMVNLNAPNIPGDELAQSNQRFPLEETWLKFVRTVGLYELFYDREQGLMRSRPCLSPLTPEHLAAVKAARLKWEKDHPESLPGWGHVGHVKRDHHLARLIWLEWWMQHALDVSATPGLFHE